MLRRGTQGRDEFESGGVSLLRLHCLSYSDRCDLLPANQHVKVAGTLALLLLAGTVRAQQPGSPRPSGEQTRAQKPEKSPPNVPNPGAEPQVAPVPPEPAASIPPHRFFDKKNKWLFAGVAMTRAADFASTKNFRSRGRDEILLTNDLVDNTPAFVAVQVGGVATTVALSYLFHRTGHHKLERWVSILHISVGSFGVVRNFSLKSANPASTMP